MVFNGLNDKITFLVTVVMAFVIYVFSISLNKEQTLNRVRGVSFIIPIALSVYCFLFEVQLSHLQALVIAETIMLLLILSLTLFARTENGLFAGNVASYGVAIALTYVLYRFETIPFISSNLLIKSILLAVAIVMGIAVIRRNKNTERILAFGSLLLVLTNILIILSSSEYFNTASNILRVISYSVFFLYFYGTTYSSLMNKVSEANKLKASLEKQLHMEIKKRTLEIERSNERLLKISKLDPLTKTYNKKAILAIIEKQLMFEKNKQFSLLMFDIDYFKQINDKYGHIQGDVCIKTLATVANSSIREQDFLGRYGGDEFIAVLPMLSLAEAAVVAERLKNRVSEMENPRMSISIGIAAYPQDGKTVEELISAADKGLYISKHKGRNAISHHRLF
ncbi:MAG: GGDEF domain-containing protein [Bacillota bacterium]